MGSFLHTLTDNWDVIGRGFKTTVSLFVTAAIGSLIGGTLLAATRVAPVPALGAFGAGYVLLVRNTPLTLILLFCSFGLAQTLQITLVDKNSPTSIDDSNFRLAVLGLSVYMAAFVCETVRSGVNTVPLGQAEAARSLGFTFAQSLAFVILPPAFRRMVQPLVNIFIGIVLSSSLAAAVGVSELTNRTQVLNLQSAEAVVLFLVSGVLYLVVALLGGTAGGAIERRLGIAR